LNFEKLFYNYELQSKCESIAVIKAQYKSQKQSKENLL